MEAQKHFGHIETKQKKEKFQKTNNINNNIKYEWIV